MPIYKSLSKWVAVATILVVSCAILSAQEFDFRASSWGMKTADVLTLESDEPIYSSADRLTFSIDVANIEARLFYNFIDNILVDAGYHFTEEHSNDNKFIDDFDKVKSILQRKYGEPDEEVSHWSSDLYKADEDMYGFAISAGELTMAAIWNTERTTISLVLFGDNYKITHAVLYKSTAHADLIERKKQEEEESAF